MISKYHLLVRNKKTLRLSSEVINAPNMIEAIDRCNIKFGFNIDVLKCVDIYSFEGLRLPKEDIDEIINSWNERKIKAVAVGEAIHRHIDMLIKHNYFK